MIRFILLLFFFFKFFYVSAQGEYNVWYFGNYAGMHFNAGAPTVLLNSALTTNEGSSCISDAAGNLLFYTDGLTVWNRNHLVMTNGNGLHGNQSSIQAALILPWPQDPDKYIIFTTTNNANANGMKYSVVDITLSGGLGAVTTKNVPLISPSGERLTAVPHTNCVDFWVITNGFNNNTFYAYLVTPAGVTTPPVTTSIGAVYNGGSAGAFNSALGMIKASPDGTRIASADQFLGNFEVFDFNATTGTLSNVISLGPIYRAFGVEFSPDNTKLYVTERQGSQLWQFNLAAGGAAAVKASKTLISNAGSYNYGALQRATDGKIYMARSAQPALGVINNPNALGTACNYVSNGFNLGGRTSYEGLPTLTMVYSSPIVSVDDTTICSGQTATLLVNSSNTNATYLWNTGDVTNPLTVSPTTTTTYTVTASVGGCTSSASAIVEVMPNFNLLVSPSSAAICSGNSVTLTASGASTYFWSDGLGAGASHTVSPTATTTYTVTGTDPGGCVNTASVVVDVSPYLSVTATASPDSICIGNSTDISVNAGASFVWSHGLSSDSSHTVNPNATTTYSVTATDAFGCSGSTTVLVTVLQLPNVSAASTPNALCEGETATVSAVGASSYVWSNGAVTDNFTDTPAQSITYTVTGTDNYGCENTSQTQITVNLNPTISFSPQNPSICEGDDVQITVNSSVTALSYAWNNGSTASSISVSPVINTDYTVTISDNNGCTASDLISVFVYPLPNVNFSGSPLNGCAPLDVSFQNMSDAGSCLWNFGDGSSGNASNPTHHYSQSGMYNVSLTVTSANGCENAASFSNYVEVYPAPIAGFNTGSSSFESTIQFTDLSVGANIWLWDFGSGNPNNQSSEQNPTYTYTDAGDYIVWQFVQNQWGCVDSISRTVKINPNSTFYIPNAFTPDGDGINDYFQGYGVNVLEYQMYIFDRWGDLLFETDDYNNPWTGKNLSTNEYYMTGVYVYKIIVKNINGNRHTYYGNVTLIR